MALYIFNLWLYVFFLNLYGKRFSLPPTVVRYLYSMVVRESVILSISVAGTCIQSSSNSTVLNLDSVAASPIFLIDLRAVKGIQVIDIAMVLLMINDSASNMYMNLRWHRLLTATQLTVVFMMSIKETATQESQIIGWTSYPYRYLHIQTVIFNLVFFLYVA